MTYGSVFKSGILLHSNLQAFSMSTHPPIQCSTLETKQPCIKHS